ncbi:MAG: hypothetical protein Kow00133_12500 [Amphiplicatus sp.]
MPEKLWMRAPVLIVALFSFTGCGDAATSDESAQGTRQDAPPAAYGAPRTDAASGEKKKEKAETGQPFGDRALSYPDDLQMTMLAYRLTDRVPPFEEWASEAQDVRRANEFDRAAALKEETGRLQAIYDSTENIGILQLRTNSQLSQYDSARGGYYLTAFSPGRVFTFNGREPLSIQIENSDAAFFWPMDSNAAQEVLAQTNRNVSIDMTLRLTGIERRSSGLALRTRIAGYSIHSRRYSDERQLAAFSLE